MALTKTQVKFTHPTYAAMLDTWTKLRDVRDGSGGFLTGEYLIGHPREYVQETRERRVGTKTIKETVATTAPTKKLLTRRKVASYENIADRIIDAFVSALSREQPNRRVGDEPTDPGREQPPTPLEEWWNNVDGAGTHIDDYLMEAWDLAATFGHIFLYMDRAPSPEATSAADEHLPFLRAYAPLDVLDWAVDDLKRLIAVKFVELAPRTSLEEAYVPQVQTRIVTDTEWALYDKDGAYLEGGPHRMGVCPVVVLYARRKPFDPVVGTSILGDPRLYIDLFNQHSETRELMRSQTFGILNVPLGTGDQAMSLEDAKAMLGNTSGTENVLFSGLAADFIQPAADNVTVYHAEQARKLRTIYRLVGVSWETDSKDAEAEGSIRLKREDLNQRLAKFADGIEKADYTLAEFFYRATVGPEKGATALKDEQVTIKYPEQFDVTPFEALIEEALAAQNLGMGATFMKELRKMLVGKFTGMADLPASIKAAIVQEIEAAPADKTPAEQAEERMGLLMQGIKQGTVKAPKPKAPAEPKTAA